MLVEGHRLAEHQQDDGIQVDQGFDLKVKARGRRVG